MTLLDKALELYKGVLEAKPRTDPMVLQIQAYIVTHWGHEGTKGTRAVEEGPLEYKYKKEQSGVRPMRTFNEQPAAEPDEPFTVEQGENALAKYEADYKKIGAEIAGLPYDDPKRGQLVTAAADLRIRINAFSGGRPAAPVATSPVPEQPVGNVPEKSNILAEKAKEAGKGKAPSNSPTPRKDVAADKKEVAGTDGAATEMPVMDVAHLKTYRAKALGEAYTPEVLKHWLSQMNVTPSGTESRTQLAQLVLQHIKTEK